MKLHDGIDAEMAAWIAAQHLFFVASAPLDSDGHINLSPRGLDALRVLDPRRIAWLDLTGSGNETAAHLAENGRLTLMFCAFEGPPRILRLYGRGRVVLPSDREWDDLSAKLPNLPGARQILLLEVERVQTSCGYGVPEMEYQADRSRLLSWAERKGQEGLRSYREKNNTVSIDGLPAPR
jgi:hypothetical protein